METRARLPRIGPWIEDTAFFVRVWAPGHQRLELILYGPEGEPRSDVEPVVLNPESGGFFLGQVPGSEAVLYKIRVDGEGPYPDPWSRAQPFGVHGPSSADPALHRWNDQAWRGLSLETLVLYELHVGTATPEGTFDALIPRLGDIKALGVTAVELLPVASFSGSRNWGYDGVSLFAPAAVYGGPDGLRRLIDAAHGVGLGVLVDVVYNHFGPDGNYLSVYSNKYFTSSHQTPWGDAVAYSGPDAAVVRELALSNAEMWVGEYHVDGIRLDATHAIVDEQQPHLVQEICARARDARAQFPLILIAEDDRNETRLAAAPEAGGYGLDAIWADDLHHQLRRAFAGDSEGYFKDFSGSTEDLATTLQEGWFYSGQYSAHQSRHRGTLASALRPDQLIHCLQNHDQIGNRPFGNRLGEDVSPAAYRTMSALLLLSPYTPLLFAGQEWNTRTPFLFFTDYNTTLGKQVSEGRRKEFSGFSRFGNREVPDPQEIHSFERSKLDWSERLQGPHASTLKLYIELLALRRSHPALRVRSRGSYSASALGPDALILERTGGGKRLRLIVNLRGNASQELEDDSGRILLHTEEARFGGGEQPSLTGNTLVMRGPCAVLLEVGSVATRGGVSPRAMHSQPG